MTTRSRAALRRRSAQRVRSDLGVLACTAWMLARARARQGPPSEAPDVVTAEVADHAFEYCPAGLIVTDALHRILRVNPAFERLAGFSAAQLRGRDPATLAAERQDADFHVRLRQTLADSGRWQGEVWNRRPDGQDYPAQLAIDTVRDGQGRPLYCVWLYRDVREITGSGAGRDRIIDSDVLSRLPDRRSLAERLIQAVAAAGRTGRTFALCHLDLDGFRSVNEAHGHATGDGLLVTVARRLLGVIRESDTLVRLGGDDFALILNGISKQQDLEAVLGRVLAVVAAPVRIGPVRLQASASIGATLYPGDDSEPDQLLRQADVALNQAKKSGKGQFKLYARGMDGPDTRRARMPARLAKALVRHEFHLYWQPRIDLASNAVVAAEARLHWQHPRRGLRCASDFMSYVAGTDLDLALGDWMLDTLLGQLETWRAAGLRLTLGVSLSHHYILGGDLPVRLGRALARHPGVDPRDLELLIPEPTVLADPPRMAAMLRACRGSRVRLALDDFGAADQARTYLRGLPVERLKLDPALVRDMLDDPGDLETIEGMLRLADAYAQEVVAAGVETLEHGALFANLGGWLVQGPAITSPLPAAGFPAWVERWSRGPSWLQLDRRVKAREDYSLMVAATSHRRWVAGLVQHLDDPRGTDLVAVSSTECRFCHWYWGRGRLKHGDLPEYRAIEPLHGELHRLAAELLELCRAGRATSTWVRLPELYGLRDRLLAHLDALIARTSETAAER